MASDYIANKRRLRGIRYMILAVALVNALVTIGIGYVESFMKNPIPAYLKSLIIGLGAYLIPLAIYAKTTQITVEKAEEKFYLKKCRGSLMLLALMLGICWQFVMVVINLPINLIFSGGESAIPGSALELIGAIFVVGVISAIFEELLFRGVIDGTMSEFNTKASIIFSSVMFALLHADIFGFVGYIIMGMVMTWLVRRTGSLYASMVFHFASNITALLLGFFSGELAFVPIFTICMFFVGVIGFFMVLSLILKKTHKPKSVENVKTSIILGQNFINLPIVLCVLTIFGAFAVLRIL